MTRLCVLGALHWDVLVQAPNLPRRDETVRGSAVAYDFGGKGGNQAVAAQRNGANTYFVGRLGQDGFGENLLRVLQESGLDLSQLQQDPGASGMSVAILEAGGEYGAVIVSEANLRIDAAQVTLDAETGLLLLQNEIPEAINLELAQRARANGSEVWLNAAPAREIGPALMGQLDVVIMNRVEAQFYQAFFPKPAYQRLSKIITKGADGLDLILPDGACQSFPAFEVPSLSSHGAGDVFVGALAAQRLAQIPWETALRYAQAAAALHVATPRRQRAAITPGDIKALMQKGAL